MLRLLLVLALALVYGSFLTAAIARLPGDADARRSLVTGRSRCPSCGAPLAIRDLVPLFSFAALGGRCRRCGAAIGWTYPLVEAGAVAAMLVGLSVAPTVTLGLGVGLVGATFLALTIIDLRHMLLPDALVLPLGLGGFGLALADPVPGFGWPEALTGALFGGGLLWAVRVGFRLLRRREGLGLGDVKLMAAIGAWIGPAGIGPALFVAALATLAGAGLAALRGRPIAATRIPFGPGLMAGGYALLLLRALTTG